MWPGRIDLPAIAVAVAVAPQQAGIERTTTTCMGAGPESRQYGQAYNCCATTVLTSRWWSYIHKAGDPGDKTPPNFWLRTWNSLSLHSVKRQHCQFSLKHVQILLKYTQILYFVSKYAILPQNS